MWLYCEYYISTFKSLCFRKQIKWRKNSILDTVKLFTQLRKIWMWTCLHKYEKFECELVYTMFTQLRKFEFNTHLWTQMKTNIRCFNKLMYSERVIITIWLRISEWSNGKIFYHFKRLELTCRSNVSFAPFMLAIWMRKYYGKVSFFLRF